MENYELYLYLLPLQTEEFANWVQDQDEATCYAMREMALDQFIYVKHSQDHEGAEAYWKEVERLRHLPH